MCAASGIGMKAAGLYAIVNASTGVTMLGSVAAGSTAAGTTGIIAGTAGVIGATGAILMSPVVIGGGSIIAASVYLPKLIKSVKK